MIKPDADEAVPIVRATLLRLLAVAPTRGRSGSDLRTACGDLMANAETLLRSDALGPPLVRCFDLAQVAGVTLPQLATVRAIPQAQSPATPGAILVNNSLIELSLATESAIIASTTFKSRQDVEQLKLQMNEVFKEIEEIVADMLDAITYRRIISLHAALTFHLIETARPLPRMLAYQFNSVFSTLKIAHWLYADPGRADQVLAENKIVHPAFCPRRGVALSE